jgi:Histidine phosphatase superfamily (branch 2)
MCPNSRDGGKESKKWLKVFAPPIKKRLNSAAPGAHLKKKDVYHLMSLCAFHSQFKMAPSPFCGLFETDEYTSYEYHADLGKFYGTGYVECLLLAGVYCNPSDILVTEHTLAACRG